MIQGLCLLVVLALTSVAGAQVTFNVTLPDEAPGGGEGGFTGRLIVFTIAADSEEAGSDPSDGPFWTDPQPLFGVDVEHGEGGSIVSISSDTKFPDAFPHTPAELPAGRYTAQAVLDLHRLDSSWSREAGNRFGPVVEFEVVEGQAIAVELGLTQTVPEWKFPEAEGIDEVVVESKLLTDFHNGKPVTLKAGVALPIDYDPNRKYAAVYVIGGFGGRHDAVRGYVGGRRGSGGSGGSGGGGGSGGWEEIRRKAFIIVLDSESPNGHTLLCDSRVNGPYAQALIEEMLPALEEKYALIQEPWARIVTGHSSGGWASLWLGTQYPETFGACWSSGPDPVDFRRFEKVDIYTQDNAYVLDGVEIPAARFPTSGRIRVMRETMTVREENGGEGVLGPMETSAQQWDSWMACWGTPDKDNARIKEGDWPVAKPLYDPETGALDPAEAKTYEAYDIRLLLANDPERYAPVFNDNIRLVCGSLDNYYLNEAVELLQQELSHHLPADAGVGYIKMVEDADHGGSLFRSEAMRAWPGEMLEHFARHGLK